MPGDRGTAGHLAWPRGFKFPRAQGCATARSEREPRAPRKTRRAHKQSHVASGPGGAGLRAGGSSGNKEPGQRPRINTAPRQPGAAYPESDATGDPPQRLRPLRVQGPPAPTPDPQPSTPVPHTCPGRRLCSPSIFPAPRIPGASQAGRSPAINPSCPSVASALGAMPFLGQDWRSPGQSWVKTADGWKRFLDEKSGSFVSDLSR